MNLIIAQVQRTMEGGDGSANTKPTVDEGTLYNMRCHVSDKTACAEQEELAAKGVEAKKPASKDNDDGQHSPTPAVDKNVDKAPSSPSYSHSPTKSQEAAAMPEKDPEDAVKDPGKTPPPNDDTPVPKKADSASKPRSKDSVSEDKNIVDEFGYVMLDPPSKKSAEVIDELREEYDWYELEDNDKELLGFKDMVNRHESNPNLIMFAM